MEVRLIAAKEAVREDMGKGAVMRGPVVYCLEETDNGKDLQKLLIDPELNVRCRTSIFAERQGQKADCSRVPAA